MPFSPLDIDAIMNHIADRVAFKVEQRLLGSVNQVQRLMTVDQTAKYLGRSKVGVEKMISARRLPVVRIDRRVFVDIRDLERLIDKHKSECNE